VKREKRKFKKVKKSLDKIFRCAIIIIEKERRFQKNGK